jgi:hypothetical protein
LIATGFWHRVCAVPCAARTEGGGAGRVMDGESCGN